MTKKEQKWEWKIRQKKVFKALKKRFTTELILVASNLDKKMRIEIDALDYMIGEMLSIKCEDGR